MEEQLLPIVSFGKYKDKSVLELLADEKYVEWLKQQSWFSNQKQIYNIVVHQTIPTTNNSKTPQHNKLQNLFLDKSNQQKLLSKLFKSDLIDGINNLFADEDITRCFGENIIPEFINNLDETTIKFEDKFNWDLVMYYYDNQQITITSNLETELFDKIKYKEQYDIEEQEIYKNKILSYEEKINIREIIDKEEIEEFEKQMKNYTEKKDNQIEVNKYENELKKYCKMRIDYELKKFRELCNELKISWYLNENRNNYSYNTRKGNHSVSNLHNLILCVDNDKQLSEQEKKTYKTIISDKINNIMEKWENDNISLIPNEIKKLQIPTPFDINKSIYCCSKYGVNKYIKYEDVLKCSSLDNVDYLKRQKKEYENEYIKNYEKKFNEQYEKYRLQYYRDIIKKYCIKNVYVEKTNENQYKLSIDICHYNNAICCELKPTLSDDYPVVLRKLKTQIELTQNNKTNFKELKKRYILIIGSFTSIDVSKEQLITIFNQSKIKVIFTDEIFETSTQVAIKYVNRNTTTEQVLVENKLIEENKFLTDNLLQTYQKLLQAEEKIKQLQEEIKSLKSQKQSKSIKDYYGKK